MYAPERHQAILQRAREEGRVEVARLATELDVTPETVRRDLTILERTGVVRRVHGGAIPVERLTHEPALADRESVHTAEKEAIAKAALTHLPPGGSIIVDAGTTTAAMVRMFPTEYEFTVVTHALPIASMFAVLPNVTLHLVGGTIRGRTMAAVGNWAEYAFSELHADVAFLGTNGITPEEGLTTPDLAEAAIKRAIVNAARSTIVLADHTKLGRNNLARVASLDQVDFLITDSKAPRDLLDEFEIAGLEVVTA